jgi:nitrogen regulatory protein P-II 1
MVPSGRGGRFKSAYNLHNFIFVVVPDNKVEEVIGVIASRPVPDAIGIGKIFVSDVVDAIDIGTKERGESSL